MEKVNTLPKLTGIIGYPLEHTLSPLMHNAAFREFKLNWCYLPLAVKPQDLERALQGIGALNFKGINVTMPYKEAVLPFLDEVNPYSQLVKAVNTIHVENGKFIGYNTDGKGFLHALEYDAHYDPQGNRSLIFGAGGAARSLAVSLAQAKVRQISIVNRTLENAQKLSQLLKKEFSSLKVETSSFENDLPKLIQNSSLIINATSIGMDETDWEESFFPFESLGESHLVCDLVYQPRETKLLKEATRRGAKILTGDKMLLYQGALSFEIWTHRSPPLEVMRRVLEEALSGNGRIFS